MCIAARQFDAKKSEKMLRAVSLIIEIILRANLVQEYIESQNILVTIVNSLL